MKRVIDIPARCIELGNQNPYDVLSGDTKD